MAKLSNRSYTNKPERNPYACLEHRRKHEKCPMKCPGREGKEINTESKKKRVSIPKTQLKKKRINIKWREDIFIKEEVDFALFCATIENLIMKYPILHRDGDLYFNDCIREMLIINKY